MNEILVKLTGTANRLLRGWSAGASLLFILRRCAWFWLLICNETARNQCTKDTLLS